MKHTTFWFNVYSIIEVFSFSTTFVERISRLEEDFVLFCLLIRFCQHKPRHTGSLECQLWHVIYRASTNMDKGEVTDFVENKQLPGTPR